MSVLKQRSTTSAAIPCLANGGDERQHTPSAVGD
jgi:hypothetical protein